VERRVTEARKDHEDVGREHYNKRGYYEDRGDHGLLASIRALQLCHRGNDLLSERL
jgi:hypothetical protein